MLEESFYLIAKSLFADNDILYVSCPINTGMRFIDWYSSVGYKLDMNSDVYTREKKLNVTDKNINKAKDTIKNIRRMTKKVVIDPTNIENNVLQWSQNEFYEFWDRVIKELVNEIVFLDGWEYSIGCCCEYLSATKSNINIFTQNMEVLSVNEAIYKIKTSIKHYEKLNLQDSFRLKGILEEIEKYKKKSKSLNKDIILKDEKLHHLLTNGFANVAQFTSFEPSSNVKPKYVHINNYDYNISENNTKDVIEKLINEAPSKSVNIRSFSPKKMKGNNLLFNKSVKDIDLILDTLSFNSSTGMYSIINENINIKDSGVSGVVMGDIIEFSPEDTPKCVDKDGICSLSRNLGMKILRTVYGFSPNLNFDPNYRIEFSIHPSRQGVKKEHTIIWEYEYFDKIKTDTKISWPNRFSRFIGDKAFGLLVADVLGLPVPRTTVISRKISPFTFGSETGLKEKWIRTCPIKKEPGKYYTGSSWVDPFKLIELEEKRNTSKIKIASVLSQDGVDAIYSGASLIRLDKEYDIIEGVKGNGDEFMVGKKDIEDLPINVIHAVQNLNDQSRLYHYMLGDISIEWVFDGENVWIVQLNQLKHSNSQNYDNKCIIVEGTPIQYKKVYVKDGLENLRDEIKECKNKNYGIELVGNVGITSHFGDILRLENVPAFIVREE